MLTYRIIVYLPHNRLLIEVLGNLWKCERDLQFMILVSLHKQRSLIIVIYLSLVFIIIIVIYGWQLVLYIALIFGHFNVH